jgi:hypothetical protein
MSAIPAKAPRGQPHDIARGKSVITDDLLKEAIDRIARTPDGRLLYLWLQRRMMGVCASTEPGALQTDHGERRFASTLIGLMAKGMDESGGRDTSTGGRGTSEPAIIFALPRPVASPDSRGAGRRITADTRVPGYDREA